jgi:O-antigen ligase
MIVLALALIAAIPLFMLARRGELDGKPERFVGVVVVTLLVESLLYPSQADVPVGPFRIPVMGGALRLHDYVVMIGLVARASVRSLPRHVTVSGMLWFLSFVWLATAAARGLLVGHDRSVVLFSAESLIGLFGGFALVAGCDPSRLADMLRRPFVVPLGVLILLLMLSNEASSERRTYLGTGLGGISVDAASVFVALGTFVLLVQWSSGQRNRWAGWATLPLLAAPLTIEQRATLIHLGGSILVVVWAMTRVEWRSRIHVPRVQLLWGTLAIVGAVMLVLMVQLSRTEGSIPFADYYEDTFKSENQQLSAQARRDAFAVGIDEWSAAPIYGYGLGHTYEIVRPYGTGIEQPATFDNVPLDLMVRSGLVGLVLVAAAAISTLRDGVRTWRRHRDSAVAAIALAAVAVLVGLGLKAGFESILEKGKLTLVLGLSAGAIVAAVRHPGPGARSSRLVPEHRGASQWT